MMKRRMWGKKMMRKMMERETKMTMMRKLRLEQGSGQLKMMMMRRMWALRSRRLMLRSHPATVSAHPTPPHPHGNEGESTCGHHLVNLTVHSYSPTADFLETTKTSKLYLLTKYFKRRICLYFYLHFIFLYILLGGQPFLTVISGDQTVL